MLLWTIIECEDQSIVPQNVLLCRTGMKVNWKYLDSFMRKKQTLKDYNIYHNQYSGLCEKEKYLLCQCLKLSLLLHKRVFFAIIFCLVTHHVFGRKITLYLRCRKPRHVIGLLYSRQMIGPFTLIWD